MRFNGSITEGVRSQIASGKALFNKVRKLVSKKYTNLRNRIDLCLEHSVLWFRNIVIEEYLKNFKMQSIKENNGSQLTRKSVFYEWMRIEI